MASGKSPSSPMPEAFETVRARLIVNAGGPWVDRVLSGSFGRNDAHNVRLVQGSHIVVPETARA